MKNRQVLLASRPDSAVNESHFRIAASDIPGPAEGEVLVRTLYLSLDPYMRMRMDAGKSYAPPVQVGEVMVGGAVGEVLESRDRRYRPGDIVTGRTGWQSFAVLPGGTLRKVDPAMAPITTALGCLGMPGVTAWYGLLEIGRPVSGETVVVSAASGAVGSVVGQIARIKGCRAVGVAGGKAKCEYVVGDLGFEACIDYKATDFDSRLATAVSAGIDVYFENVGGKILDAVLPRLNAFARIPFCGYISEYDRKDGHAIRNMRQLLVSRARLQGFIISEHPDVWDRALSELSAWVREGKLRYRESIVDGLENAPRAFIGMLQGTNLGKQLVKLA